MAQPHRGGLQQVRRVYWIAMAALAALSASGSGCAAMTNPLAEGIPARRIPNELLAPSKANEETIPLSLLRQPASDAYRLAPGDVLGVYVEGFLGDRAVPLPVHVAPLVQAREQRRYRASTGYPVTVLEDGTIDLPVAGPLPVQGFTLAEARETIRSHYVAKGLLKAEAARLSVTLVEPRQYSVLVLRQEAAAFSTVSNASAGTEGVVATSKRGQGFEIDLPAYQNDILHALARTGGLPGLDAYNEIIVYRDCFPDGNGKEVLDGLGLVPAARDPVAALCPTATAVRIPLRLPCGKPPPVKPEDVVLKTGDVVFLEARDREQFFTAGLLPPGAHLLPRDRDLDVLEAVATVRGPMFNGAFGGNNLSGTLIQPGLGNPSPALVTVLRRTAGGGQVPIVVDLRVAARDPRERILVKSGDLLILQEFPEQALTRYFTQTFFNFNLYWQVLHEKFATGVVDVATPDRLPGRVGVTNFNQ